MHDDTYVENGTVLRRCLAKKEINDAKGILFDNSCLKDKNKINWFNNVESTCLKK